MIFSCDNCNYSTNDKSNYRRHIRSPTHQLIVLKSNNNNYNSNNIAEPKKVYISKNHNTKSKKSVEPNLDNNKCGCGKTFAHQPSLSRHKKKCAFTEKENEVKELKGKVDVLTNKVEDMNDLIFELIKSNKDAISKPTTHNNYKISVKNYIQQNYPNAPVLKGPENYAKLTFDDKELIDTLIYKYKHKVLHEYLGDFLVEYYKKDDPADQSVWSSDISRLTYIVKEALADKKSIWNHDYKGVKTKKCIVDPLLQHIKKYIGNYWEKNVDLKINKKKEIDVTAFEKRQKKYNTTYAIETDIDNGLLANDIIKYIASHLHMDKNINVCSDFIDIEAD